MSQSLSRVIVHIIFSTKNREPVLDTAIRPRMHAYLATIGRDNGCEVYRVGGVADHVHIATTLPRTLSQSELIELLKVHSSRWIKEQSALHSSFAWQRGYGAFSVSPSQLESVVHYIEAQDEHHKTMTFQEEYRRFLDKHGIAYDERYVWD
jgi:putative transposase